MTERQLFFLLYLAPTFNFLLVPLRFPLRHTVEAIFDMSGLLLPVQTNRAPATANNSDL